MIELVERTKEEIKESVDEISGDIYIGAGESRVIRRLTSLMKELTDKYHKLRFHFVSGDSFDLLDKLDKGLLDFCVLIQPISLIKYELLSLGEKDTFGIMLRKDDPLSKKENFTLDDVKKLPLIVSRQAIKREFDDNLILDWFNDSFNELNIVGT
ncbi:MAG: hypothetical protein GX278_06210 [Aeromonadales bacterium]|nr:hypothetical protein [Aeromonadales bacterium]